MKEKVLANVEELFIARTHPTGYVVKTQLSFCMFTL